jgi:hypothetical protein
MLRDNVSQLVWVRDLGSDKEKFVPPIKAKETRIDDTSGNTGLIQDVFFMPYIRDLGGNISEYLHITLELVRDEKLGGAGY